jgi:hypothetical protein
MLFGVRVSLGRVGGFSMISLNHLPSGEILLETSVAYQDPRECLTRTAVQ